MALIASVPSSSAAQVAIEAALQSDYRQRGFSVSDGKPVASVSAVYDHSSGSYIGALAAGMIDDGDPELLLLEGNVGYAVKITPTLSLDGGISHSSYYSWSGTSRNYQYTEIYVGLASPNVGARLSYSPNYYFPDTPTLYAEVNGGVDVVANWSLSAHAGALFYFKEPPFYEADKRYDWRLGVSRRFGLLGVHGELSGRIKDEASMSDSDKTAVALVLTRAF